MGSITDAPPTIYPLDLHYLNLQRELHRIFQTLALAAQTLNGLATYNMLVFTFS